MFNCEIILSISVLEARKVLRMLLEENISEPVIRDYILCVVIVGLPTLVLTTKLFCG
jgi:hypothetical protein